MMFGKMYPRMFVGWTAGVIDGRHHKRLGAAWMLFAWCCLRQTGQGEEGIVCRGAVVTYADIAAEMNCSRANVRKWMRRLVEQRYIRVERKRRGICVFVRNPKKFRVPKLGHSKAVVSVQVEHFRVPMDGHSKPIHAVESAATSQKLLRNNLTKLLKNNNTTAAPKSGAVSLPLVKEMAEKKTLHQEMTPEQYEERKRRLHEQWERMQESKRDATAEEYEQAHA